MQRDGMIEMLADGDMKEHYKMMRAHEVCVMCDVRGVMSDV